MHLTPEIINIMFRSKRSIDYLNTKIGFKQKKNIGSFENYKVVDPIKLNNFHKPFIFIRAHTKIYDFFMIFLRWKGKGMLIEFTTRDILIFHQLNQRNLNLAILSIFLQIISVRSTIFTKQNNTCFLSNNKIKYKNK
jgi:hypothetical protein